MFISFMSVPSITVSNNKLISTVKKTKIKHKKDEQTNDNSYSNKTQNQQ